MQTRVPHQDTCAAWQIQNIHLEGNTIVRQCAQGTSPYATWLPMWSMVHWQLLRSVLLVHVCSAAAMAACCPAQSSCAATCTTSPPPQTPSSLPSHICTLELDTSTARLALPCRHIRRGTEIQKGMPPQCAAVQVAPGGRHYFKDSSFASCNLAVCEGQCQQHPL